MTLKILFVPPIGLKIAADYKSEYQMAAIEQQVFGIAKELSSDGYDVFILRAWQGSKKIEKISGVNLINVNISTSQKSFQEDLPFLRIPSVLLEHVLFASKAYGQIKELSPDIIIISNILTGFFVHLISGDIKKMFITHDHDIYMYKGIISHLKGFMLNKIVNNSEKVITLNNSLRTYLSNRGYKIDAVIPNAVGFDSYQAAGDEGFMLFSGRLVSHKKVDDLLKVYSKLSGIIKEDLVIIGDGPCRKDLELLSKNLGSENRVHFVSFLPKKEYRDYLSKCSFFVFPSKEEAFGVVLIEAMASGKPVIARNIIGPRDIITHGYNGFLFNDEEELEKNIKLLLTENELKNDMGKSARKTVAERYTFKKIAKSYEYLIEQILNE